MAAASLQQELDLFEGRPLRDTPTFRSLREVMSNPFFGLSHKPRMTAKQIDIPLENGAHLYIRNSPGEYGIPTIHDRDILTYLGTLLVERLNRGEAVARTIQFNVHDYFLSVGKRTGGRDYAGFKNALQRLKGVTVFTNITTSETVSDSGWSWISEYKIHRTRSGSMGVCEVTLGEWFYRSVVEDRAFLAVGRDYFELKSGLDKAVHNIISRHIGNKTSWHISLERLHLKTGSDSAFKRFAFEIREMIGRDPFPLWSVHLTTDGRFPIAGVQSEPKLRHRGPTYLYAQRRGSSPFHEVTGR